MLPAKWTAALPLAAAALAQAFTLDAGVGSGIYTFEAQADGSFLTKREVEIEETFAYNATVSLKYAKRNQGDDEDSEGKEAEDETQAAEADSENNEPKTPDPLLKNYPQNWETIPLPNAKEINCPERHSKIRHNDYKEAVKMLEHFCKYYYVQKRSNAAFVSGGAIVYVCNSQKKSGICSIGEYNSAENDMNKECLPGFPAWARYQKKLDKTYGRDIIGNPFCESDEQVLKHDLHKPTEKSKKKGN